jgi:hypothetical protein
VREGDRAAVVERSYHFDAGGDEKPEVHAVALRTSGAIRAIVVVRTLAALVDDRAFHGAYGVTEIVRNARKLKHGGNEHGAEQPRQQTQ